MKEGSATIVTGSLGGGKGLCAVDLIMEHLSFGGTVVTNIPLFVEKIAEWLRDEFALIFDPERLILLKQDSIRDFHRLAIRGNQDNTVLMVLDEAALDIGARDWATLNDEVFNFVVLVRKMKIDLVLVAQDANDVDKRIRQKMQREIHCRSLKNFWSWVTLPVFVRVDYSLSIGRKPWKRGARFHWKAESWGMFDSHALHGEKAQAFSALAVAKGGTLQRVQYSPTPYYIAAAIASAVSAISTCLLAS